MAYPTEVYLTPNNFPAFLTKHEVKKTSYLPLHTLRRPQGVCTCQKTQTIRKNSFGSSQFVDFSISVGRRGKLRGKTVNVS